MTVKFTGAAHVITADNYRQQLAALKAASGEAKQAYYQAIRETVQILVAAQYGKDHKSKSIKKDIINEITELTGFKSAKSIYLILAAGRAAAK